MRLIKILTRSLVMLAGFNISIKLHFLHSHLDKFPGNLVDLNEEQEDKFNQYVNVMEERYQDRWDKHMKAKYC